MAKSIGEICEIIEKFSVERNFKNDEPRELVASIFIEMGELAEKFQWETEFKKYSEEKKKEIGFEFVDVIFYLFRLANKSGVDIEKYFDMKLPLLEKKFPIGVGAGTKESKKIHKAYRKSGKSRLYE